ncbi:MAG TPA: serine/threonine-protein kinase, partial [Myxococcota bacterium]|nr:serine/threonine-protein kinase [Myxococcota bacterium]
MRGTQSTAPSDPLIGKVIDNRYRILSLVAQGGMGRVYQAEQAPLGRVVALKVLDTGKTPEADKEMRQRFILEAAACARLNHPNTVRIFDYGKTWDDVLYISMEYIHGRTLHHVIKQEAPLPLDRVIRILRQMCSSLREAHAAGLIHRDLKPSNVMLTRHGDEVDFVKVLDFGLVRQVMGDSELTQVDAVVGSPSYMSPEQIRGERLDQRSDIYSLGVLMYTCIVGKTPFAAESPVKVMMAHLNSAPPPMAPVCPALTEVPMLEWVVRTCLEKEPVRRFASVEELLKALRVAERQLRGEHPPAPVLENGKLMIGEEWTSSSSMSPMTAHSGSISRSSLPVPPPSESSVSSLANKKTDRRLPILAGATLLVGAFVGMLLLLGLWLLLRPGQ